VGRQAEIFVENRMSGHSYAACATGWRERWKSKKAQLN